MQDLTGIIHSIVTRVAASPELSMDDDLLDAGLLDSVGVLGIVAEIEKQRGIKLPTSELTEDNFRSINAIAAMTARLESGPPTP